jgi:phage gp36-like protein
MAYLFLAAADFEPHIQSKLLTANSESPIATIMEPIEKQNIAFIRSKLSGRYDMDPVFAASGDDRNQVILKILLKMCLYDFIRRNAARKVPDDYREDYNWAIKELEKLQSGHSYAELPGYEDGNDNYI